MNKSLARAVLISAGIIWGFGFVVNKWVLNYGWNDSQLLFVRFFSATVGIFIVYFRRIIKTNWHTVKWGLFLGIFLYFGFFFQTWGLVYTSASNNALITAGYIVMLPVIVFIFGHEKVHNKTILAGFITLIGIAVVTIDPSDIALPNIGDMLTFVGAFFYAIHIFLLGKKTKEVDLFVLMAFQLLLFSVFAFVVMMAREGFPTVDTSNSLDLKYLIYAVSIGLFGSFVAFVFQSIGQKHTSAAEAGILISTESFFGPVFAIIFLGEKSSIALFVGMIFIVWAYFILQVGKRGFREIKGS